MFQQTFLVKFIFYKAYFNSKVMIKDVHYTAIHPKTNLIVNFPIYRYERYKEKLFICVSEAFLMGPDYEIEYFKLYCVFTFRLN